ncbi:hypothetical protein TICRE_18110 [Tissierella creatinophila DSM 6911]|uniref:Uncharacterized protein n=1 Tax=Tissierella creatinophila DSM 6911 TaxID=1123403 RepID=A0A1U7M4J9_TISCR|nr:hypothetical protein TICRE_18110 [Tissierella creatinophila DSM 6911]
MTGSWTMDAFFIGCALLMVIPAGIWLYYEVFNKDKGAKK